MLNDCDFGYEHTPMVSFQPAAEWRGIEDDENERDWTLQEVTHSHMKSYSCTHHLYHSILVYTLSYTFIA